MDIPEENKNITREFTNLYLCRILKKSCLKRLVQQGYSFVNIVLNDVVVLFERSEETSV
jgi:hypothetical protein